MATYELARYRVDTDRAEDLLARWDAAVSAIRACFPGLLRAHLTRLDETTWVDVWQWESTEAARAAAEGASKLPEAAAMFSVIAELLAIEHAEIVREA